VSWLLLCWVLVTMSQTLVFRLDDIQCDWLTNISFEIVNIFMTNNIPLTVGVITGTDIDCIAAPLKHLYQTYPQLLEIASHSVTHPQLINMTLQQQLVEINNSKVALESVIGAGNVRTFIPPFNSWNYDTITACTESGYDIISPECTAADLGNPSQTDYVCTSNMYLNRPAFFPQIDGLVHVPIGASISSFCDETQLLTLDQLFGGTLQDCYNCNCSVKLQMNSMYPLTFQGDPDQAWSAVMMHPDCFPENSTSEALQNYFLPLFQRAVQYKLKTIAQLVGPHGSRPAVNGTKPPATLGR